MQRERLQYLNLIRRWPGVTIQNSRISLVLFKLQRTSCGTTFCINTFKVTYNLHRVKNWYEGWEHNVRKVPQTKYHSIRESDR